jgi:uncharacterized lipoprotein YddW (UPF0748 family)
MPVPLIMPRHPVAACLSLLLFGALVAGLQARPAGRPAPEPTEVRALWVARTTLATPGSIEAMVNSARASGFNTLLVQVRGRGDAYYTSSLEPRAEGLARQSVEFDPLRTTLKLAHQAGLRVHAWVCLNLVANAGTLPASRLHVAYQHPEWLMVPRAIAKEMLLLDPKSPLYLDKLARWTRMQSADVEGLFLSPVSPGAIEYAVTIVADLASRYALDGVHLDYVRYPNDDFDYSRDALARFRAEVDRTPGRTPRPALDTRPGSNPFALVEADPDRWRAFRRGRLTSLVSRLREAIKTSRPNALVTAAVVPDAVEATTRRLQDWRAWLDEGLIDIACPMAYATDPAAFSAQVAGARSFAGERRVWAGIGAYRLSSSQTIESILIARRLGVAGIILFSYDSMAGAGTRYLSEVGHAVFQN